jgi:hypothetical protein
MGQRWFDGYSADVEIYLLIDGKRYDVAQICRGQLFLRDSHKIPPSTSAKLVIKIDGIEESDQVILSNGAVSDELAVNFF